MDDGNRLLTLEQRTRELETRVAAVEQAIGSPHTRGAAPSPPRPGRRRTPAAAAPSPSPERPSCRTRPPVAPRPRPSRERAPRPHPSARTKPPVTAAGGAQSLEDLVGGRVLAWIGGVATLLGLVFLFAMAISNGWIGEGARTLLGGLASAALLVFGAWLHPRKGRTEAALAAAATGIAGLFVTATVAAQVYGLVPAAVAIATTLAVGAVATALAVRWRAELIAALGIVGALLSPVLAGTSLEGAELWMLWAAFASAAGVLIWQRWDWLAVTAFTVATPQWLAGLSAAGDAGSAAAILVAFGLLGGAAAAGFELRRPGAGLSRTSAGLLAVNALVLAAAGWLALTDIGDGGLASAWLVALAVAHVAAGLAGRRAARISSRLALLCLAIGVVLADLAFEAIVAGPAVPLGLAAGATCLAFLRRHVRRDEAAAVEGGMAAHLCLAIVHGLVDHASPAMLTVGHGELGPAALVLAGLAASCLASGRLLHDVASDWEPLLNTIAAATIAYLTALAFDGPALVAAWSLEAAVLGLVWRRSRDVVAAWAAIGNLGLALAQLVSFVATPDALVFGLDEPGLATLAGVAAAGAAAVLAWVTPASDPNRPWLAGAAAVTLLYVASALVVTPFQPGAAGAVDHDLLALDVRQQGQAILSAFWAVVGALALVVGLRRDRGIVRGGALALLLVTVAKVFVVDLAALDSVYRVISFVALGLLLLASAFVWQRVRPRPPEDLRDVPDALR